MHSELHLEIKGIAEDGTFEGIATTYGNLDQTGDRIEHGAFSEDSGKEVPLLWSHKRDEPVGLGKLTETDSGVRVEGKLDLDSTAGREAYSRLKKGIVKSLSIGFQIAAHAFEGSVRIIRKGVIREVSLVLFPANEKALVTAVKEGSAAKELLEYL